jgi:hypothetical protein
LLQEMWDQLTEQVELVSRADHEIVRLS